MSKLTRFIAIGAVASLPIALAPSAVAQTPSPYTPYTPQEQVNKKVADDFSEVLGNRADKLRFNLLFRPAARKFTVTITAPGKYSVKITGRQPGKRTRTLSQGSLTVPPGYNKPTASISLKATSNAKDFRKSSTKRKFKGRTIPVKIVTTFVPTTGPTVTSTETVKIDK